ncbi:MAG: hypothetical protein KA248_09365 [Kiritimatiellae bacterium]|nr:hypothetical protein [Kiritimatiellia bacterium]
MDHFTPPIHDPERTPARDPDEDWPSSGPRIGYMLLAALVIAGLAAYAYFRWKNRPAEEKPEAAQVQVGDTRERVIDILGKPRGSSLLGGQEILIYTNGQVVIENGLAASVDLGANRSRGQVDSGGSQIILQKGGRIVEQEKAAP